MVEEKNENSEEWGSCQLAQAEFFPGLVAAGGEGVCLTEQCLACFAGQLGWFILIQGRLGQLACLSPPIDPSRFTLACLQAPPPPLPLTWLAGPSSSSTTNLASLLLWHLKREVVYCCCNYLWQRVKKNSLTNVFGKDHRVWAGHLGVDRLLKKVWAGHRVVGRLLKILSGPLSCGPSAQKVGSSVDLSCP